MMLYPPLKRSRVSFRLHHLLETKKESVWAKVADNGSEMMSAMSEPASMRGIVIYKCCE